MEREANGHPVKMVCNMKTILLCHFACFDFELADDKK